MKQLIITFISICIFSLSCSDSQQKQEEPINFQVYLNTLETIKLPYSFDWKSEFSASLNYNKRQFKAFKHAYTYAPIGQVKFNDNLFGIFEYSIADNGHAPFLTTFDSSGVKLDSIGLSHSGGGEFIEVTSHTVVKNNEIIITDTTKTWTENADYIRDNKTMQQSVEKEIIQITSQGKFITSPK